MQTRRGHSLAAPVYILHGSIKQEEKTNKRANGQTEEKIKGNDLNRLKSYADCATYTFSYSLDCFSLLPHTTADGPARAGAFPQVLCNYIAKALGEERM